MAGGRLRIVIVEDDASSFALQEDQVMRFQTFDQGADRSTESVVCEHDSASLVAARLRRSGYPFLRSVKCEVCDGVIVIFGEVPTFHLSQLAT